jgi:hypothetical protein
MPEYILKEVPLDTTGILSVADLIEIVLHEGLHFEVGVYED